MTTTTPYYGLGSRGDDPDRSDSFGLCRDAISDLNTVAAIGREPVTASPSTTLDLLKLYRETDCPSGNILVAQDKASPYWPLEDVLPSGSRAGKVDLNKNHYTANVLHRVFRITGTQQEVKALGREDRFDPRFVGSYLRRKETRMLRETTTMVFGDCETHSKNGDTDSPRVTPTPDERTVLQTYCAARGARAVLSSPHGCHTFIIFSRPVCVWLTEIQTRNWSGRCGRFFRSFATLPAGAGCLAGNVGG